MIEEVGISGGDVAVRGHGGQILSLPLYLISRTSISHLSPKIALFSFFKSLLHFCACSGVQTGFKLNILEIMGFSGVCGLITDRLVALKTAARIDPTVSVLLIILYKFEQNANL